MKRNYIHFIKYAICIGLPLLSSCSDDFLEPKALSFFEPTSTFTTREGLQAALTSCDRQAVYVFMGEGAPFIPTSLSRKLWLVEKRINRLQHRTWTYH